MRNKKIYIIALVTCLSPFGLLLAWPTLGAYTLEVPIPGMPTTVSDPGEYISKFFIFGLGLVGFLAVAAIVVGGIIYMTGGTVGKVEKGKEIIWGAITGLVLLLCSYLLLYTIDPTLVNLSPFELKPANIPASQGGTQCPGGLIFDPTTGRCVAQQPSALDCDPATQIWSPTQGRCVARPAGTATECNNPATCTPARCWPGGTCIAGMEQWTNCQCVQISQPGQGM